MAPVSRGYCKMESLASGEITLWHLALANDHISVMAENQRRANERNNNNNRGYRR
jgi:hypothetical protein